MIFFQTDCGQWCDPEREFKCKDSGECLPLIYRCDHEQNCKDGSDEQNCGTYLFTLRVVDLFLISFFI